MLKFSNLMAFWFLQLKQVKWSQNRKWNYTKQIFPKLQYTLHYHYATFKKYNCLKMMIPMNRIYLIVLGDIEICCICGGVDNTQLSQKHNKFWLKVNIKCKIYSHVSFLLYFKRNTVHFISKYCLFYFLL